MGVMVSKVAAPYLTQGAEEVNAKKRLSRGKRLFYLSASWYYILYMLEMMNVR